MIGRHGADGRQQQVAEAAMVVAAEEQDDRPLQSPPRLGGRGRAAQAQDVGWQQIGAGAGQGAAARRGQAVQLVRRRRDQQIGRQVDAVGAVGQGDAGQAQAPRLGQQAGDVGQAVGGGVVQVVVPRVGLQEVEDDHIGPGVLQQGAQLGRFPGGVGAALQRGQLEAGLDDAPAGQATDDTGLDQELAARAVALGQGLGQDQRAEQMPLADHRVAIHAQDHARPPRPAERRGRGRGDEGARGGGWHRRSPVSGQAADQSTVARVRG